ncbi:CubicO group peptidase (beta-lactamase class C family) [Leucobacter komagatae]|uniref:CubicO group peptidase (Beta-lactamase class C family) n=2 Tax=Leucobacter komagatae TaxID=55969 RepID=A0A542Y7G1_9MICO|nr:CubicO group peptidase (beta-lactamase class C family) [Leucobacter komagatae]
MLAVVGLTLTACTSGNAGSGNSDQNTVSPELATAVDEAVANALELSGSTEAVVGVWQGDDKAYVRGYGEGVTGATTFRGAQASQPVMCAMLLDLAGKGQIALGRQVSKDLPRQAGIADISYAQLCNQTSALADFKGGFGDRFANNPTRPWPEQELLANGLARSPLAWQGKNVYMSDTNAVLLDRAIRLKENRDTYELLQSHVFDPAGMTATSYPDSFAETEIPKGSLKPLTYPSSGDKPVCEAGVAEITALSPSMLRGAGATLTTVTDLKDFYAKYLSGGFGDKKSAQHVTEFQPAKNPERDEAGEPTSEPDTEGTQIGFGIEKVGPLQGRAGAMTGSLTAAYSDPATGLTVVVALNNSSAGAAFSQALAFQLAALSGAELPWSAEDQGGRLTELAVCQPAAEG